MTNKTIVARLKEKLHFFARNNKLEEGPEEVEFIADNPKSSH